MRYIDAQGGEVLAIRNIFKKQGYEKEENLIDEWFEVSDTQGLLDIGMLIWNTRKYTILSI